MNLSFTFTNCFYSKNYCGCPTASADSSVDEDKGCSPSEGTTFGLVWRWDDARSRPSLHSIHRQDDIFLTHAFSHACTASLHHPLRGDLLGNHLCIWHQALPECMDGIHALAIGVPSADGGEVQVWVVRRH